MINHPKHIAIFHRIFIHFLCLLLVMMATEGHAKQTAHFPIYPLIAPNVAFWEEVYGTYTTRQGILHDKNDLSIVYGVIDLVDWNTPGAASINKNLIQLARHQYKTILTDLGHGQRPESKEEKRLAALFAHKKHPQYLKAKDNIRLQIGQKDRFLEGIIRSGKYMQEIKAIFLAHQMPLELAYLPHVESSFNPQAHSKAGAIGLWQFTGATGKNFMAIDDVIDERYDPLLASQAAAKLLKINYDQLGSWPLALTAYNYGRPGMVRALDKQKTYENIIKNHQTKLFKFAARNFYSEFVAALRVARKLEKDHSIIQDRPSATIRLRMENYADAEGLRRYFRLSREDFAYLNPALRDPVLNGKKFIPKGYLLCLPATKLIRQQVAKMGSQFYHPQQLSDQVYFVQKGDTVNSISRKFRVSTQNLIRANNLNHRAIIHVGQKLVLPEGKTEKQQKTVVMLQDISKRKPPL